MSNETEQREPLWTDEQALARLAMKKHEQDRARLHERIAELEAELAERQASFDMRWNADMRAIQQWQEATGKTLMWPNHTDLCMWLMEQLEAAREWQPAPDGMYEYPNWNGKGTVIIRILNDGAELEQWHNSLPDDIEEISLSSDYRLYQRKREGAG